MRRFLLVALALLTCQTLGAQTRVNHSTNQCSAATSCSAPAFSSTTGNLLVGICFQAKNTTVTSVTDTQGNTFVTANARVLQTGAGSGETWYAKNITGNASDQVTCNVSVSDTIRVEAVEYSGADATTPLDQVAIGSGASGASLSTANLTTTVPNEVFVSLAGGQGIITAGTNYTLIETGLAQSDQDRNVTSTGTYSATATTATAGAWIINLVTFKSATQPSAPKRLPLLGIGSILVGNLP